MVKVGELINYALIGGVGYIVYKNWTPLKKLVSSISTGASGIIGGTVNLLEGTGNKLADVLKKDELTPQQVFTNSLNSCEALGWKTPEEKAKCVNLDYVKRGIKNENKLLNVIGTTKPKIANTPAPAPVKSSSSSNNKIVDTMKTTKVRIETVSAPTDSLSGANKGKGSYIVKKADGSRVTRYFQ